MMRLRYAPTPSGDLHLGNIATALFAWWYTRACGGTFIVRMDDLDRARVVAGAARRILDDLRAVGIDWDEGPDVGGPRGPYNQSERQRHYAAALERLRAGGHAFACFCSRKQLQTELASTPGADTAEESYIYRERCGSLDPVVVERRLAANEPRSFRLRATGTVTLDDAIRGRVSQDLEREAGQFVIWRKENIAAYHLACAVDEIELGVTDVVRGADLLPATGGQIRLIEMLGGTAPRYAHTPLVVEAHREKMSKRDGSRALRQWLAAGRSPEELVGAIAHAAGLLDRPSAVRATELIDRFDVARLRRVTEIAIT